MPARLGATSRPPASNMYTAILEALDPKGWMVRVGADGVPQSHRVVPPAAGRALARALGIPHLAPVVQRVELIDVIESGPVEGNWADGGRTAAFFSSTE